MISPSQAGPELRAAYEHLRELVALVVSRENECFY
jgi:AhpD family alkylhydroperoxidase